MKTQARSKEHVQIQKLVKIIEGHRCGACDTRSKDAAGHHLIFYRDGGPADLQNMMTLCAPCHRRYHRGALQIDIDRF